MAPRVVSQAPACVSFEDNNSQSNLSGDTFCSGPKGLESGQTGPFWYIMAQMLKSGLGPGKPKQRKGQNEKFMNVAHFL